MISGNRSPLQSIAERERACFFEFKQEGINESTTDAFQKLNAIPSTEFGRVIQLVLKKRKQFESGWAEEYKRAKQELVSIPNQRIVQNYAIIRGFHSLFAKVFSIDHDITEFLKTTATINTQNLSSSTGFDPAEHFFQTLNEFTDEKIAHCVVVDEKRQHVYINLPAVEILFKREKWMFAVTPVLGNALKEHPAFIASSVKKFFPTPLDDSEKGGKEEKSQKRAWVFDARKLYV